MATPTDIAKRLTDYAIAMGALGVVVHVYGDDGSGSLGSALLGVSVLDAPPGLDDMISHEVTVMESRATEDNAKVTHSEIMMRTEAGRPLIVANRMKGGKS